MHKIPVFFLLLVFLLFHGAAQAGGNKIIFGNIDAHECYMGANLAQFAAESALPACNLALNFQKMTRTERASTLVNRGILHTHMGHYDAAFADFEYALRLIPAFAEAYLNRGNTFLFIDEFGRAAADYSKAIEAGTRKLHAAHYNRGLAREALKQPEAAYQDFLRSSDLLPSWALASNRVERYADMGFH